MRLVGVFACFALTAGVASADKVLVLKAEGRADKNVRAKIEGAVLQLAASVGETTAGDITYSDAAAMVGCKPDEDKCKAEVLGMLSVDEIVTITATPKPGGIEVSVRRIGKGGVTKTGSAIVALEKADQLEPIAPLFGAGPASPLPPPITPVETTPPTREAKTPVPANPEPSTNPVPPPTMVAEPTPPIITAPVEERRDQPVDDRPRGNRRLTMIGMVGGGAMLLTGMIFWGAASGVEDEIDQAPKRTREDLENLRDLEAKGDGYATAGNLLFVSGLVLGGVSTYFFLKSDKRSTRSALITPTANAHGGGIAITGGF